MRKDKLTNSKKEFTLFVICVVGMAPFAIIGFCIGAIYYGLKFGAELAFNLFDPD